MTQKITTRNPMIDLMKFCFCLLIMTFHIGKRFKGGYIGVEFFFIVSGYLMANTMTRKYKTKNDVGKSTIHFILHKARSIYPYYVPAFILTFVITAIAKHYTLGTVIKQMHLSFYNFLWLRCAEL